MASFNSFLVFPSTIVPLGADTTGLLLIQALTQFPPTLCGVESLAGPTPPHGPTGIHQRIERVVQARIALRLAGPNPAAAKSAALSKVIRELDPEGLTVDLFDPKFDNLVNPFVTDWLVRVELERWQFEEINRRFFGDHYERWVAQISGLLRVSYSSLQSERALLGRALQRLGKMRHLDWKPSYPWSSFLSQVLGGSLFCVGRFALTRCEDWHEEGAGYVTKLLIKLKPAPDELLDPNKYVVPEPALVIGCVGLTEQMIALLRTHQVHPKPTFYIIKYSEFCQLITDLSGGHYLMSQSK